ncbi:MAG: amidohydrolase family protein, partial [Candidatus Heimdallarchaeota archaeon]
MYDLLIQNGQIIDGSTNPRFNADVGIQNGRIQRIGNLTGAKATQSLDVEGLIVCPGFIDVHSHSDLMLLVEPEAEQKIMQGITTEILGQDGLSVAPLPVHIFESWKKRLAGLLGTPNIEWDWVSVGDYFQRLERSGITTNVAYLVPHGAVRACVIQFEDRSPTTKELAQMQDLVDQSMRAGAIGLSTGLIYP